MCKFHGRHGRINKPSYCCDLPWEVKRGDTWVLDSSRRIVLKHDDPVIILDHDSEPYSRSYFIILTPQGVTWVQREIVEFLDEAV